MALDFDVWLLVGATTTVVDQIRSHIKASTLHSCLCHRESRSIKHVKTLRSLNYDLGFRVRVSHVQRRRNSWHSPAENPPGFLHVVGPQSPPFHRIRCRSRIRSFDGFVLLSLSLWVLWLDFCWPHSPKDHLFQTDYYLQGWILHWIKMNNRLLIN